MSALGVMMATLLPCVVGAILAPTTRKAIPPNLSYVWCICVLKPCPYFPYLTVIHSLLFF